MQSPECIVVVTTRHYLDMKFEVLPRRYLDLASFMKGAFLNDAA